MTKTKKMLSTFLALVLTFSLFSSFAVASAAEVNESSAAPREILQSTYSQVLQDSATGHLARITITYTSRYDGSNVSGKYITGVMSASAENVYGWYSVGDATIVDYEFYSNNQVAVVDVIYTASNGYGNVECTGTVTIDLLQTA